MANSQRGEVDIFLDKKRTFKFNTNAMVELEDALGFSMAMFADESIGVKTMVHFVWAALLHDMPNLTFKEAADLMDHGDFTEISQKVMEAVTLFFPKSDEEPKKTRSGLSGAGKN